MMLMVQLLYKWLFLWAGLIGSPEKMVSKAIPAVGGPKAVTDTAAAASAGIGDIKSTLSAPANSKDDLHPLYVSVTEINHNATGKTLEISVKIFTDDLEKTLGNIYHTKVDLFTPKDKAATDKQVAEYVQKRLTIQLDGKPVALEFVGFERENDAVWSYFQASAPTAPKKVGVKNTILYELYEKQLNLMHITVGGKRKSTRLNNPDTDAVMEY